MPVVFPNTLDCETFLKHPCVNPLTGRPINPLLKTGVASHLIKACDGKKKSPVVFTEAHGKPSSDPRKQPKQRGVSSRDERQAKRNKRQAEAAASQDNRRVLKRNKMPAMASLSPLSSFDPDSASTSAHAKSYDNGLFIEEIQKKRRVGSQEDRRVLKRNKMPAMAALSPLSSFGSASTSASASAKSYDNGLFIEENQKNHSGSKEDRRVLKMPAMSSLSPLSSFDPESASASAHAKSYDNGLFIEEKQKKRKASSLVKIVKRNKKGEMPSAKRGRVSSNGETAPDKKRGKVVAVLPRREGLRPRETLRKPARFRD